MNKGCLPSFSTTSGSPGLSGELVRQLGEKLYGKRTEPANG